MKKNVLALSIAAMIGGFAGTASAQVAPAPAAAFPTPANAVDFVQSEGGNGHILLVPYYTAQNGNATAVHVVNTDTKNGKAVKVRFRGAANSDDVLDFTVLLSPGDVWTGTVTGDDNGAHFSTSDTSCTYPNIFGQSIPFKADRLKGGDTKGTKEGYIEILNMADTVPGSDIFKATKHAAGGKAPTCDTAVLDKTLELDPTKIEDAVKLGFDTPSGQLTGDWYIINVTNTNTFSGAATAIKAVSNATTRANGNGNFVLFPQDDAVSAAASTPDTYTADPVLKTTGVTNATGGAVADLPVLKAVNYDFPDLSTPYLSGVTDPAVQASKLTAAVANGGVSNQFDVDKTVAAKTDWVLSMPTRRYSVGANYSVASTSDDYRVFNAAVVSADDKAFFTKDNTTVDADGNICVATKSNTFYDREEASVKNGAVISPGIATVIRLCGEVNVLSFNAKDAKSVLGASIARGNADVGYANGWGAVSYNSPLPVVGSAFISATNAHSAPGVSGNYGITWPHRFAK